MRMVRPGYAIRTLSTGLAAASSGAWINLGSPHMRFGLYCSRATSIGTSNFTVSLRGSLTTTLTTGPAVGAIGAYTPSTLVAYTQAVVGKVKMSTALVPAQYVKAVCSVLTTAANRKLRIILVALP